MLSTSRTRRTASAALIIRAGIVIFCTTASLVCHDCRVENSLTVDVWGDVVCPFCYLGFQQLRRALSNFDHAEAVSVTHHAFELDRGAPQAPEGSLNEMLAAKYGLPLDRAAALNQRVSDSALALGMVWSLDRARPANTFDTHRLVALAATQGRQEAMLERLFRAYFSDGLLVSDRLTLEQLALEVGVEGAPDALSDDHAFAEEVRRDEEVAARIGITGVPAFVINRRGYVSGAQGEQALLEALNAAWSDESNQAARP